MIMEGLKATCYIILVYRNIQMEHFFFNGYFMVEVHGCNKAKGEKVQGT